MRLPGRSLLLEPDQGGPALKVKRFTYGVPIAVALGLLFAPVSLAVNLMAVQPDGKILLVGGLQYGGPGTIARFNPNGSLDSTFAEGGILRNERFSYGFRVVAVAPSATSSLVETGESEPAP